VTAIALASQVIGTLYFIVSVLVSAAVVGWGTSLVWNKFAPLVDAKAPTLDFVHGFAAYTALGLLTGLPHLLGASTSVTTIFNLGYALITTAVSAAIVGWGVELLYNAFVKPRNTKFPSITWLDGFAAFWALSFIVGLPILFG
jgi:uncharacterized membrane protein YcjF (UPF0283 family)